MELLLELSLLLENDRSDWSDLVQKYNIVTRKRYLDARNVRTYKAINEKKQTLFQVDIDSSREKKYRLSTYESLAKGKSGEYKTAAELGVAIGKLKFPSNVAPKDDKTVMEWLSDQLMVTLNASDFKDIRYIEWSNKATQLVEVMDGSTGELPYLIFVDGSEQRDESAGLGKINMTTKEFRAWLDKMGSKKKSKPAKRQSSPPAGELW